MSLNHPPNDPRRRRPVPVLALLLAVSLLTSLTAVVSVAGTASAASASAVPRAECARYDQGIRTGICVRDPQGGIFWLGTLAAYDGREIYCIDYRYATAWSVQHHDQTITGTLVTSLGAQVPAPTVASLNYLVTRYPAGSVDATTAAAIQLIVRQVMGDAHSGGHGIPGGLTAATSVRDVSFVPDNVVARARQLWRLAVVHRGPWKVAVSLDAGPDGVVGVGESVTATVRGTNGSGGPEDLAVRLTYAGLSGPASVRLGADGVATVVLNAPKAGPGATVTASVTGVPSPYPVVVVPENWKRNPTRGASSQISQRGLLARQRTVTISARAAVTVVKHQPVLVTQASAQQVQVGAQIHDTVTVSGTHGAPGSFRWWLLGPVAATKGTCPGVGDVAWNSAAVLASGEVATTGDGSYQTPSYTVSAAEVGCLTYAEARPETDSTLPAYTMPGVAEETVLVTEPLRSPRVTTTVSRQTGLVGARLFDRIAVSGIAAGDELVVRWTLHGPVRPRAGVSGKAGCDRIAVASWLRAPVAATGSVRITGPGEVSTPAYVVRRPGCYTYSESVPATAGTAATSTPPGIAVETAMITRPGPGSVPNVPTGPYRALVATSAGTLRILALSVNAPIRPSAVRGGVMGIPSDVRKVGWLASTAQVRDVIGSAVIAGHVSDRRDRPGALARLGRAKVGMVIVWTDPSGRGHRYVVQSVDRYSRAHRLPRSVFATDGQPLLRVITCSHRVRRGSGYHYTDNLVVTARAVS